MSFSCQPGVLEALFKIHPVQNFFDEQSQQKVLTISADFFFYFNFFFNNVLIGFESVVALQAVEDHLNKIKKLLKKTRNNKKKAKTLKTKKTMLLQKKNLII